MSSDTATHDTNTAAAGKYEVKGTDRLVLVFDYRSLIEAEDVDAINFEAWKEVLDSFGYGDLTFAHFMRALVLKSPSEVMTALCPYTTKAEWGPILNKRVTRLNKEVTNLCYAEMLPIVGLKDFILDCSKKALVTCVFLSPFPDDVTRRMLEIAEVGPFIDLVHSYNDREYALLEALEMINIRPDRFPEGIEHRWSDDHLRMVEDIEGNLVPATTGSDEVARSDGVLNKAQIVVMATDSYACEAAASLGCKVVGVTYNGGYYGEENEKEGTADEGAKKAAPSAADAECRAMASSANAGEAPTPMPNHAASVTAPADTYDKTNHEQALLLAGAAAIVNDYQELKYEYLAHLRTPPAPKPKKEFAF